MNFSEEAWKKAEAERIARELEDEADYYDCINEEGEYDED